MRKIYFLISRRYTKSVLKEAIFIKFENILTKQHRFRLFPAFNYYMHCLMDYIGFTPLKKSIFLLSYFQINLNKSCGDTALGRCALRGR